jgi:hypothetical protein
VAVPTHSKQRGKKIKYIIKLVRNGIIRPVQKAATIRDDHQNERKPLFFSCMRMVEPDGSVKEYDAGFRNSEMRRSRIGDNRRAAEQKNIYESQ